MKGYVYNNTCYIFPNQVAAAIPEQQDVTEYLIQYDELDAYKEINTTLADKLFGYNYNTMTVNPKVWKDHQNDDLHRPGPDHLTLTYADGCEQYISEDWRFNSVENNTTTELLAPDDMDNKFFDWNGVHKFDASYTGGTCNFRDLNWLELHTAVDDPDVTTVELSIVPKNYACENPEVGLQEKVVIVNLDEETKVFESDQVYGLVDWAQGVYRYSATLDGNAITCSASGSGSEGDPVTIWNEDQTGYYMTISVKDADQGICEVVPTTQGTFIFTIVPENSIGYTGDECLDNPAGSAYEGDTVTLTAASGYTTTNVTLTSDDVQLTVASATTWTFTMPAVPVTINVAYSPQDYEVTFAEDYSSLVDNYGTGTLYIVEGQQAMLNPASGVDFNSYNITAVDANSNPVTLEAPTAEDNRIVFTMPQANVVVTIAANL